MKRVEKRRVKFSPLEAFWARGDLQFGPWRLTDDGLSDWAFRPGARKSLWGSDEEALEGYLDLLEGSYFVGPMFDESDWAFWRFERILSAEDAFVRVRASSMPG